MARRNQNLAGLAALGALGYALTRGNKAPVEDRVGEDVIRRAVEPDVTPGGVEGYAGDGMNPMRSRGAMPTRAPSAAPVSLAPAVSDRYPDETERALRNYPAPVRTPARTRVTDTGDETARLARRYPAPATPRMRTREELLSAIPGSSPEGWQGGSGERVTGNETTRNINNILNAPVPGFVPVGRGVKAAQSASRAVATRGAEEVPLTFLGKSGARPIGDAGRLESSATRQLGSESGKLASEQGKLTGPSKRSLVERDRAARAAKREAEKEEFNRRGVDRYIDSSFEGGMKKGGKAKAKPAKKMASGGVTRSSASKRADGIASKGKTKCKMY